MEAQIKSPQDGMPLSALRLHFLADELQDSNPGLAQIYRTSASTVRKAAEAEARKARRRARWAKLRHDLLVLASFGTLVAVTFSLLIVTLP